MVIHAQLVGAGTSSLMFRSTVGSELGELERLLDEIIRSRLQRLSLVDPVIERRHHHHAYVSAERRVLLDVAAYLPAIAARHHHVEEDEGGLHLLERLQRVIAVVGDRDRVSTGLEIVADDVGVIRIIVDDEYRWMRFIGHKRLSEMMLCPYAGNSQARDPPAVPTMRLSKRYAPQLDKLCHRTQPKGV